MLTKPANVSTEAWNAYCWNIDYFESLEDFLEAWEEEEEDSYEPDDSDLEMGFDPYMGCYTDDC